VIDGPTTLVDFHRALLASPCFVRGETCRELLESEELAARVLEVRGGMQSSPSSEQARPAGTRKHVVSVELDGRLHEVRVHTAEPPWSELARRRRERSTGRAGGITDAVVSPMQGTVLQVEIADGDQVEVGEILCVVEAMKMENPIVAHRDGVVSELGVAVGQQVSSGQLICVLRPAAE
jgi:acetyl-CoA/propionyl-CoA carboxylase biotin carboxyl carrier protein